MTLSDYESKDPDYIEESEDILLLKKHYTPEVLNVQKGHWTMLFTLLSNTLFLMYKHTKFSHLVSRSHIHTESNVFSLKMKDAVAINAWSRPTANIALTGLKKLLRQTNINADFIIKIAIPYDKKVKKNSPEFCLPFNYKKRCDSDPCKKLLIQFITIIKSDTKYKSQKSITMFIAFIIQTLVHHRIDILNAVDITKLSFGEIKEAIPLIYPKQKLRRKVHYTMIFICYVLKDTTYLEEFERYKKTIGSGKKEIQVDHDPHRITKDELEKMYESSKENVKYQAMFLLMISTGIRTIGVSNIKMENICTITNNIVTINKKGRTIEKGNKWFTFMISEKLAEVLLKYITTCRKNISTYLFPGRGEDIGISPSRISTIIKNISIKAGLSGKHIHAHSLRHSFAHILLETGNKPELVSKMLGHTSVQTTEQYYLKESAAQVSNRMNIPWLERKEEENPVPDFLNTNKKRRTKSERNKMLKSLVKDFKSTK